MVVRTMFGVPTQWAMNPWMREGTRLNSIAKKGLAKPKKYVVFKTPPPWYSNPEALRPAQKAVVNKFIELMKGTKGMPLEERIRRLKANAEEFRRVAAAAKARAPPAAARIG